MPVEKFKGSEIFNGTMNETGRLDIQATKTGEDTTLAGIVWLVEEAQETKAPIQSVADRVTAWFLPAVLVLAVIGYFTSGDTKVAISILLVACPCAFAIATPTAVTAGISNLARRAVLVKGGMFLELAGKIDDLLVDKTGTFTLGMPRVVDVASFDDMETNDILRLEATAGKYSEHSLARSVLKLARERGIETPDLDEFHAEIGMGVSAVCEGNKVIVGKEELLREKGVSITKDVERATRCQSEQGRTVILVAKGLKTIGFITIADEIRPQNPSDDCVAESHGASAHYHAHGRQRQGRQISGG